MTDAPRGASGPREGGHAAPRVLVVDDEPQVRRTLARVLTSSRYEAATAASVPEARELLAERNFDLVLCDIHLPGESGLVLVGDIEREHPATAVLMVTGEDDPAVADVATEYGANGYLVKPFKRNALLISAGLALRQAERVRSQHGHAERPLAEAEADRRAEDVHSALVEAPHRRKLLDRRWAELLMRLGQAIGRRDLETGDHVRRVGERCGVLARICGLAHEQVERIRLAAPMHDLGKVAVPDAILLKPGALEPAERKVMEHHTTIGCELLSGSGEPLLDVAAKIALTHHEKLDGSGYPRGLIRDQIPLEGRIAAIVDVFDALTSDRPYRPAMPEHRALDILRAGRGGHFDPLLLDVFFANLDEVLACPPPGRAPG